MVDGLPLTLSDKGKIALLHDAELVQLREQQAPVSTDSGGC